MKKEDEYLFSSSVTAVIPVYNDLPALEEALPITIDLMEKITSDFEIIIAEDASNDGSAEYAKSAALKDSRIIHLHRDGRLGRGSALTLAAGRARGDIFCYFDVDLATDMTFLPELLSAIDKGADVATGSRLLPESDIIRSQDREIKSRGYNALVRLFLRSMLYDHQCGFKAFNTKSLKLVLTKVTDTHWFWDTEVLVRAQQIGMKVVEIPVIWKEGDGTTVKTSDIWTMGRSILKLWWKLCLGQ